MTRIELPFPPPLHACFNHVAKWSKTHGRNYVQTMPSKRYREWQAAAHKMLRAQSYTPMLDQEVSVLVRLVAPDRRARDAGNCDKALLDLLTKAKIITDDSNKYVRLLTFAWANSGPGCVVYIRPFEEAE